MAITEKKILGNYGEDLAVKYLKKNKYKILEKNYKCKYGEIDIIAKIDDVVCFVEVKTRSNENFGTPSEAVDTTRQKRYINTANYYMSNFIDEYIVRFDIIEVEDKEINHIVSAFDASF